MTYTKKTWASGEKILATDLNDIEQALEDIHENAITVNGIKTLTGNPIIDNVAPKITLDTGIPADVRSLLNVAGNIDIFDEDLAVAILRLGSDEIRPIGDVLKVQQYGQVWKAGIQASRFEPQGSWYYDDFMGKATGLSPAWEVSTVGAGGYALWGNTAGQYGGVIVISTGGITGDNTRVDLGDTGQFIRTNEIWMEFDFRLASSGARTYLGLTEVDQETPNDGVFLAAEWSVNNNFRIISMNNGTPTTVVTSEVIDQDWHTVRFHITTTLVESWLDGVKQTDIVTNIPDAPMRPEFYILTPVNSVDSVALGYVMLGQDR